MRNLTEADIYSMAGLQAYDVLTPEARKIYKGKTEDQIAFRELFFEKYLDLAVRRWNDLRRDVAGIDVPLSLNPGQLDVLVGYDDTAPERMAPCAYCFSQLVFQKAAEQGLKIDLEKLKSAQPDKLAGVLKKLQPIREAVLKENQKEIYFFPRRWKRVLEDGSFERNKETGNYKEYGSAVLCEFDDHTIGDQLELALAFGIEFLQSPVWRIIHACGQAGNFDENGRWLDKCSHLHCLQTFSGRVIPRKKDGKIVYNRFRKPKLTTLCLPAEKHGDAERRLLKIEAANEYNSEKPIEIVESAVRDNSCFAFSFDAFTPELISEVEKCASETEIYEAISRFFQKFTSEEIGNMKMLFGENLGDRAEGKTMGRDGDLGKPPGLGPFGGKPEPDDRNIFLNLEKLLPPVLYQNSQQDPLYERLVKGLVREVQNESGFAIEKILCRIARISKDNGNHLYHLWLVKMKNASESGFTVPVREIREMSQNQVRFWIPLKEVFKIPIGGIDGSFRKDRIYCSALINLARLIERFGIPAPEGMAEFKKKLDDSRKQHYQ